MRNQFIKAFSQYRVMPAQKALQRSESIMQLMLRAWERTPAPQIVDNWQPGDKLLVNGEHIGVIDALAIVNNNRYAWVEVRLDNIVQHFGINLNDIRRVEVC